MRKYFFSGNGGLRLWVLAVILILLLAVGPFLPQGLGQFGQVA